MSIIHYIIPIQKPDIDIFLSQACAAPNVRFEDRGKGVYYFWVDKQSTKGVDITFEQENIEIRNTALSNRADFQLTNDLSKILISLSDGFILDEEDKVKSSHAPLFSASKIEEAEIAGCLLTESIFFCYNSNPEVISVAGPIRAVYFGEEFFLKRKMLSIEQLRDEIFALILRVNYGLPDGYKEGNVMTISKKTAEEKLIVKLITNKINCIIGAYDYILFPADEADGYPTVITNKILASILPEQWELVDEVTIVAPMLDEKDWNSLKDRAKLFDIGPKFITG
ncbi:MAG: hypothetical protein LBG47_04160 [Prevotellaceae bacterium]|nr:hypothetical protein [Prevotellaceae bacterium]